MTDEYDDAEWQCPGKEECDDEACEERKQWYVEVQRTVRYAISAHDEDEALELMWNADVFSVSDPSENTGDSNAVLYSDFEDDGDDPQIESEAERRAAEARIRAAREEMNASA